MKSINTIHRVQSTNVFENKNQIGVQLSKHVKGHGPDSKICQANIKLMVLTDSTVT